MPDRTENSTSAGIEALIERLKQEGVDEGRSEADRIITEAETRARAVLADAEVQAKATLDEAGTAAEKLKRGGEEALKIAMRDAVLELKQGLTERFAEQVSGTVSNLMRDDELLQRMVVAVAARSRDEAGIDDVRAMEVILPRAVVGLDDLRRKPEELREGSLTHFAATAAAEMFREGVSFTRADDDSGGIRVVLADQGVIIDLTDRAVAEVILRHLQPRFRALLESVVS